MTPAPSRDPYLSVVRRFNRAGVRYVVVGMSGINYYARSAAESFGTMDYDLFLEPSMENVRKAVRCLQALEFRVQTASGTWRETDLRRVVRDQRTLVAVSPDQVTVELLLRVSGYPFSEMARDAATIPVEGVPVKVGQLDKLLWSKKLAGRPKDRRFLRRYQDLIEE